MLQPDSTLADEHGPTLSYADRCLGDEGVRQLCARLVIQPRLTSLDLRGCHIHAPGVAAVAELIIRGACKLASLSLEWNAIGTDDAGSRADAASAAREWVPTLLLLMPLSRNRQVLVLSTQRSKRPTAPSPTSTCATTGSPRLA